MIRINNDLLGIINGACWLYAISSSSSPPYLALLIRFPFFLLHDRFFSLLVLFFVCVHCLLPSAIVMLHFRKCVIVASSSYTNTTHTHYTQIHIPFRFPFICLYDILFFSSSRPLFRLTCSIRCFLDFFSNRIVIRS